MKRIGEMIQIKPEGVKTYIDYHANPLPGVNKIIHECNIRNYTIFHRGEYLFAYYEYIGDDFEEDMRKMAENETTQQWWSMVKPLMLPLHDREKDEFWSQMEEVYHLD